MLATASPSTAPISMRDARGPSDCAGRSLVSLGDTFDCSLASSESHNYEIELRRGEIARFAIRQRGVDVRIDIFDPAGDPQLAFDSPTLRQGTEWATVLGTRDGRYRVEVYPVHQWPSGGWYRFSFESLRQATDRERQLVALRMRQVSLQPMWRNPQMLDRLIASYEELVAAWQRLEEPFNEAHTLDNLAGLYTQRGQTYRALLACRQALAAWRRIRPEEVTLRPLEPPDHPQGSVGLTFSRMAVLYESLGDLNAAAFYHWQALRASKDTESARWHATTLYTQGVFQLDSGAVEQALATLEQSLDLAESMPHHTNQARVLWTMGKALIRAGRPTEALEVLEQALHLFQLDPRYLDIDPNLLEDMGAANLANGQPELAGRLLRRALERARETDNFWIQAESQAFLGELAAQRGDTMEARRAWRAAAELFRRLSEPQDEIDTLGRLWQLAEKEGQVEEAVRWLEKALAVTRAERDKGFPAIQQRYRSQHIDLLMQLHRWDPSGGHDIAAFEVSERMRAQGGHTFLRRQNAARPTLQEERISLRLDELVRQRGERHGSPAGEALEWELTDLLLHAREYQAVEAQRRPKDTPAALNLGEIQAQLDPGTLLLHFVLGEEGSFLWAVSSLDFASFELPPKTDIEALAREVHGLLAARGERPRFETADERAVRIRFADARYPRKAAELSQQLLSPARDRLQDARRLVIVADGALQAIPFAALPWPSDSAAQPLLLSHEVVTVPSMSELIEIRRTTSPTLPARTLAVIADPVFDTHDPRVSGEPHKARRSGLARLPGSRQEGQAILSLVAQEQRLAVMDFAARRDWVLSGALEDFRILHFATHGVLDDQLPELSGLALSLVDENGAPVNGYLRLRDLQGLELRADLAVLSACQTALGRPLEGQGLVSLTRAFLHAGAASVIASLWSPQDQVTAELMTELYRGILVDGLSPAAALRGAQLRLRDKGRPPFYWAVFVLHGDWQPGSSRGPE